MEELNEHEIAKRKKYQQLLDKGIDPFPKKFEVTATSREILEKYYGLQQGEETGDEVKIAGRIMALRPHGKSVFGHVKDFAGRIQIFVRINKVGEEQFGIFGLVDVGDIVGVTGNVFKTRTGEVTIDAKEFKILTKSLKPLPEKWHGLKDVELRYRHRYVDLIVNENVKEVFVKRSRIISEMRKFLDANGFIEVETPMMQSIPGGAMARPFMTHHNALDIDLYLRIAPELYLKRLIAGGFEKIYEINRNFRNEGISTRHNPEFTMMELYQAYTDYNGMMEITEQMLYHIVVAVNGSPIIEYKDNKIDMTPPYRKIGLFDSIEEATDVKISHENLHYTIIKAAEKLGMEIEEGLTHEQILNRIFEDRVQESLIQPTFITDYPLLFSPLAKLKDGNSGVVDRFEFFTAGLELGNAYSELNNAIEQRERLVKQEQLRGRGDAEAHRMDEDFLTALEYGMPPTGGLGIGVDRLVMALTNSSSIRDVIFFPQLKPEGQ